MWIASFLVESSTQGAKMKRLGQVPSDFEIRETIERMVGGSGTATVVRVVGSGTVYISFHRPGGCGKLMKNVIDYLVARVPNDTDVVVMQSPVLGCFCQNMRVRRAGEDKFVRLSAKATAARLGISDGIKPGSRRNAHKGWSLATGS